MKGESGSAGSEEPQMITASANAGRCAASLKEISALSQDHYH